MRSKIDFFANKKFVIILPDQISSRNLAYTGALIGLQFGRKIPEIVGRDQLIPLNETTKRKHLGITTQNLPVLNGLSFENMRILRENLRKEKDLIITEVTEAVAQCKTYKEYAQALAKQPLSETNYWGIGIYGDQETINKYTSGLKLYANTKIPNSNTSISEERLVGEAADLPMMKLILANNRTGGQIANAATILGVTYGKLYGDSLFGPDLEDSMGNSCLGLPMIDLAILNGHPDKHSMMRELRETLHQEPDISVVDVINATGSTRCYEDYLAVAEKTPPLETTYWGLGLCGTKELLDQYTADLNLYITSGEEQALLKNANKNANKNESKKNNYVPKGTLVAEQEKNLMSEAAAKGNLGWQKHAYSPKGKQHTIPRADDNAQNESISSPGCN